MLDQHISGIAIAGVENLPNSFALITSLLQEQEHNRPEPEPEPATETPPKPQQSWPTFSQLFFRTPQCPLSRPVVHLAVLLLFCQSLLN